MALRFLNNAAFAGNVLVGSGTIDNPQSWGKILQVQNSGVNGASLSVKDSNNEWNLATYNSNFYISDGVDERLTIDILGNTTFASNVNTQGLVNQVNSNAGTNAYVTRKWTNDVGNAEIWRNSSTRTQTGAASQSFNIYNGQDVNLWSGGTRALNLDASQNATFAGNITTNGDITIDNSAGDPFLKLKTTAQEYVIRIDQSDSEKLQIRNVTAGVNSLSINTSSDATFAGDVLISGSTKEFIAKAGAKLAFEDANPLGTIRVYNDGGAVSRLNIGGAMWVRENLNVGIGSNSPVGRLYVGPTWDTSAGGNNLYIKNPNVDNDSYDPQVAATADLGLSLIHI